MLTENIDLSSTFQAEVERTLDSSYPIVENGSAGVEGVWNFGDESGMDTSQTDSWGFEEDKEEVSEDVGVPLATSQTDSWGFDDDQEEEVPEPKPQEPISTTDPEPQVVEEDSDDAWGWNDDETLNEVVEPEEAPPKQEEAAEEEGAWDDDPWADSADSEFDSEPVQSPPSPPPPPKLPTPKIATRLERAASKNKTISNGSSSPVPPERKPLSNLPPPLPLSQPNSARTIQNPAESATSSMRSSKSTAQQPQLPRRPSNIVVTSPTETYRVTAKMKQIVRFVEDVVAESKQFAASNLFAKHTGNGSAHGPMTPMTPSATAGATLIQSASSVMDLYQALYPVRFESELSTIEGALQFSNDCLYLSDSVDKIEREANNHPQLKERLAECKNDLKVLGDSWFEDAVVSSFFPEFEGRALTKVWMVESGMYTQRQGAR